MIENLEEAFGSPLLVLKERLKSLSKIGNITPDSAPARQISWFHDFEAVLQDIMDLGESPDMNMQMGAFGPSVQEQVLKALTDNPVEKQEVAMAGSGKQPKDKMVAYKEKIVEYRRKTQLAEKESGAAPDKKVSKAQLSIFLFEKEPEVLTRGHPASDPGTVSQGRLAKLEERAIYSNYGDLLPTRRPFPFMVRVTGYVITFINKCRLFVSRRTGRNLKWSGPLLAEASLWFSAFPTTAMFTEMGIKEMEVWVNVNMDNS